MNKELKQELIEFLSLIETKFLKSKAIELIKKIENEK